MYTYIHTNNMLENGLMYFYQVFNFNVIYASTTYTNRNHELNKPLLHKNSTFTF